MSISGNFGPLKFLAHLSDGTEGWNEVSEEDKIAMNYYEKHQVNIFL